MTGDITRDAIRVERIPMGVSRMSMAASLAESMKKAGTMMSTAAIQEGSTRMAGYTTTRDDISDGGNNVITTKCWRTTVWISNYGNLSDAGSKIL
jgi:hypothetical protein